MQYVRKDWRIDAIRWFGSVERFVECCQQAGVNPCQRNINRWWDLVGKISAHAGERVWNRKQYRTSFREVRKERKG